MSVRLGGPVSGDGQQQPVLARDDSPEGPGSPPTGMLMALSGSPPAAPDPAGMFFSISSSISRGTLESIICIQPCMPVWPGPPLIPGIITAASPSLSPGAGGLTGDAPLQQPAGLNLSPVCRLNSLRQKRGAPPEPEAALRSEPSRRVCWKQQLHAIWRPARRTRHATERRRTARGAGRASSK